MHDITMVAESYLQEIVQAELTAAEIELDLDGTWRISCAQDDPESDQAEVHFFFFLLTPFHA